MKTFYELIPQSVVSALGWTLVHAVWQGIMLAVFAFAGFYILRKKSAAARYNFGIILLGLQVAGSVVTYFYYSFAPAISYQPISHSLSAATQNWQKLDYNLSAMAKVQLWLNSHLSELVICWLIGTALLMLRFAGAWIYTEHLRSNASIVMDKEWRVRFGMLIARMNISQSIEFRQTVKILTPMVIGAFRPAVLIPFGLLTGFSTSQIEAILAHELAHIRRNDYLVNLLQSFVEVVFFFHPALWWISERVRTEREHCCDDIALTICGDKMVLANALVKVAEWQSAPELAMAFVSKKPFLLNRIRRILGVTPKPSRPSGSLPVIFLAIGLIAGVSFYAVGQLEKKQTKKVNKAQIINLKENPQVYEQAVIDTVRREAKTESSATAEVRDSSSHYSDKLESLAEAYRQINGKIFSIDEIRSSLATLNQNDIEILSAQLPLLKNDSEKMRLLENTNEAIRMRIEILYLDLEKKQFEVEQYNRELEKLEWAKNKASQIRGNLSEKHSQLLRPGSKKDTAKLSDAEVEKQLAELEEKIKEQQNKIIEYNNNMIQTRVNAHKAEVPYLEIEKEIEKLNNEMEDISKKMEIEARNMQKLGPPPPPREPAARIKVMGQVAPPPTEPKPAQKATPIAPPPPPFKNN